MAKMTFLGAAQTVTGSQYLVESGGERLMVDCGMFQGEKALRLRNWVEPTYEPRSVRWVILTHTHLDHIGRLPRLVKQGFRGRVICTPPTCRRRTPTTSTARGSPGTSRQCLCSTRPTSRRR